MKNRFRFRLGQEWRANAPDEDGRRWGRAKRANRVHTTFIDYDRGPRTHRRSRKTWKNRRDKQYHVDGRQTKHEIVISPDRHEWLLSEYFKKHDIPYRITPRREQRTGVRWIKDKRTAVFRPRYVHRYVNGQFIATHQIGYELHYYWIPLETPIRKEYTYYVTVDYTVTWWSNKDIDIEKILASMP